MTSIQKALTLLECFSKEPYEYTVAQLAAHTGLNRTTVYRDLLAMEEAGLLMRRESEKAYALGPMAYRLGSLYLQNAHYEDNVATILSEIAAITRESVGLARREGDKVISIFSVETHQVIRMEDKPGVFYPIYKGLYGKGLMAYWDPERVAALLDAVVFEKSGPGTLMNKAAVLEDYERIRQRGYVVSIEETAPYVVGVGVPVRGLSGEVRNVVAVSMFKTEDHYRRLEEIKDTLMKYGKELAKYME